MPAHGSTAWCGRQDLRPLVVDRDHQRRLARLAQQVRPVGRVGHRQEPAGELDERLAEVVLARQQVDGADDLERRDRDDRLGRLLGRPQLGHRLGPRRSDDREQHGVEVHLGVRRPWIVSPRCPSSSTVTSSRTRNASSAVVEDVGDPVLAGADQAARDQRVGVEDELDPVLRRANMRIHARASVGPRTPGASAAFRAAITRGPAQPSSRCAVTRCSAPGCRPSYSRVDGRQRVDLVGRLVRAQAARCAGSAGRSPTCGGSSA